jgi:hypothetical protein
VSQLSAVESDHGARVEAADIHFENLLGDDYT